MSSTPSTVSHPACDESDVRALDTAAALAEISAARRTADRAEAEVLALAMHLVDLFPVTAKSPAASWHPDTMLDGGLRVTAAGELVDDDAPCPVAGVGTPEVAERAVVEIGAAMGVSYRSALSLVADAVELCFRLPTLWGLVQTGALQTWKARRVAQATQRLSAEAAAFVDRQAGIAGRRNRLPANLGGLITQALNMHDPEIAEGLEEAALAHRDVVFDFHGTESIANARLTATLDTVDALDLDAAVSDLATTMGRLGDTSPVGVRRAHALGLLAHPQRTLELFGTEHLTDPATPAAASPGAPTVGREWNAPPATLYLHLTTDDLRAAAVGDANQGGTVERLGAATLDLLADWLRRTDRVTIRPVLDPTRVDPVDRHDPPEPMREAVILRDGHCVFPGCSVDARGCDLDHIDPYVPPDDGGPPDQTDLANLACLCRRHHRLKTFTAWTYQRAPDGDYTWTSPHGATFRVTGDPKR